jgi:hypothetical protein
MKPKKKTEPFEFVERVKHCKLIPLKEAMKNRTKYSWILKVRCGWALVFP